MTALSNGSARLQQADPSRRVNYTQGLVLGVDEFQQEQLYGIEHRRMHNRFLHGYGTVWGLDVTPPPAGASPPEISVSPGVALDPRGREIVVSQRMCVRINDWLAKHKGTLSDLYVSATPSSIPLCVMLRYRECEVDRVPVPGEPCRTQADAMQPSRIAESFELRLCIDEEQVAASLPASLPADIRCAPITQPEEEAVRAFGDLLKRIEITSDAVTFASAADLEAEVQALAPAAGAGGTASSLPSGTIFLEPPTADEMLREMFRIWVTEVRPRLLAQEVPDECEQPRDCAVLLAELTVAVRVESGGWTLDGTVAVDETRRPCLLHTRLLQEWLLGGGHGAEREVPAHTFATLRMLTADTVRAWVHYPAVLTIDVGDVEVLVDGAHSGVIGVAAPLTGANAFDIRVDSAIAVQARVEVRFYADRIADPSNPDRTLVDSLNDPAFSYLDRYGDQLRAYVVHEKAGGDLNGAYPQPSVVKLRGKSLADVPPTLDTQFLGWSTAPPGEWRPRVPEHQQLANLDGDDHTQYLHVDGHRPMAGSLDMGGHKVTNVLDATDSHDAVTLQQLTQVASQAAGGDLTGTYPDPAIANLQAHPVDAHKPQPNDVLTWDQPGPPVPGAWRPKPAPGGVTAHSALTGLGAPADDHPQYFHVDGRRAMTNNLNVGAHRVTNVANAIAAGDAIPLGQPVGGDVAGMLPTALTVVGIQGRHILASDTINDRSVLTWVANSNQWEALPSQVVQAPKSVLAPGKEPISIVAAGTFQLVNDGKTAEPYGPNYNALRAVAQATPLGSFLLAWEGAPRYEQPTTILRVPRVMYVVKGTVWVQSRDLATFVPYTLNVIGFAQTGILINLIASGGGFFAEQVAGFMVEVTEIRAG